MEANATWRFEKICYIRYDIWKMLFCSSGVTNHWTTNHWTGLDWTGLES